MQAVVAAILFAAFHICQATYDVTLAWDPNSEPDIAKYRVYYGLQSGVPSQSLDVGNVTTATIANLDEGTTYFFTVSAINTAGLESGPSNEVSYTTPSPAPEIYTLTVIRGKGTGPYPTGTWVPVSADEPTRGEEFAYWEGDTSILLLPSINSSNEAFIPRQDVTITAMYSALPTYTVTVTNGTGDGNYFASDTVPIVADAAPAGQQFAGWTGNVTSFVNASSPTTTFTMPSSAVTVTATYSPLPTYTLAVTNGTGSGNYPADEQVTVTANAAPAGQQFAAWTGNVTFADPKSPTTTVKMPPFAATATATYRLSDKIRYYPRSGYRNRMVGGIFEGTNDPVTGYIQIHKITTTPPLAWTAVNANLGNYRYLRYRGPNGSYGNVAEIEFYRDGIKVTGTGYGTEGSYRNRGATFSKALDGNINTYFNGPTADGNYVGIITTQ